MKTILTLLLFVFVLTCLQVKIMSAGSPLAQYTKDFIDGVNEYQELRQQYFIAINPISELLFQKLDALYKKISKISSAELALEVNPNYHNTADHLGRNLAFLATSIFEFKNGLKTAGDNRNHQLAQSKMALNEVLPLYNYLLSKMKWQS